MSHSQTRSDAAPSKTAGSLWNRLFDPVDIAGLVWFRIIFGATMLWNCWRYLHKGWIESLYVVPRFHFTYFGFGWVQPWPDFWMHVHFQAMSVLSICVMLGLVYRLSATLLCAGFTYLFLL